MKSYAKFVVLIIAFLAVLSVCGVAFRIVKYPAILTEQNQWRAENKFIINGEYKSDNFKTDKGDLLRVMQQIKGILLWGSWAGGDPNTGRLISTVFTAPPTIGIFVAGYPCNHKNKLYIEQLDTGERITFPDSDPGEIWTAITLCLPPQWQQTQVRIVAVDNTTSPYGWLGVSSPFQITWRYHLERHKHHLFLLIRLLPLYLCSLFFFIVPGLFISSQLTAKRICDSSFSLLLAFGFSALCGYLIFWVYFLNSGLGKTLSMFYMLGALYICFFPNTRQTIYKALTESDISRPLGILILVGLFYLALLYIYNTGDVHRAAANRFVPLLPPDHIIPYFFSERLFAGKDPRLIFGDWLSSDRPPLQTGIVLSQRFLGSLFGDKQLHYQLIATIAQCAWIPAVWSLSRNLKLSFFKIAVIFTFLIFSGFFLLNSVYVWPKLLAGAFVIGTFILLLGRPQGDAAYGDVRIILASALAALGVLSHGGGIFTLIAIALVLLWPSCFPGIRRIILGGITFILFLTPWLAYQKFYEPPGNRLVKWHIAGVIPIDGRNVIQTLRDSYSQLNWRKYLRNKQENFKTLIGDVFFSWPRFDRKTIKQKKTEEFFFTLNALGVLNSGWLVLIPVFFQSIFRKKNKYVLNSALKTVFPVVGIAILVWELFMFIPGSTIIHQGSYATMILLFCGLAILVSELPRWSLYALLFYHIINFGILWVYPYSPLMNYFMTVTACIGFSALLYFLYVLSKNDPECETLIT